MAKNISDRSFEKLFDWIRSTLTFSRQEQADLRTHGVLWLGYRDPSLETSVRAYSY